MTWLRIRHYLYAVHSYIKKIGEGVKPSPPNILFTPLLISTYQVWQYRFPRIFFLVNFFFLRSFILRE